MPTVTTDDNVKLFYEECGAGVPIVFVHEFAGDYRSWEPQMRYFARRYRCIAYNARGYPPSDVPGDLASYSQHRAVADIISVMDGLGIDKAHIVGLSMGGFASLHFGLNHPDRALSLVVAGCGYGAERDRQEQFKGEAVVIAERLRRDGMAVMAKQYSLGPTRVQFQNKDPRGWQEFADMLAEHSAEGAAFTQEGVQRLRPSLYDLEQPMSQLTVATLIITGDEDWPCLTPNVFMKRVIPSAALVVMANTGHTLNLEEPARFNQHVDDFLTQVDAGRWPLRDPRAVSESLTGMR